MSNAKEKQKLREAIRKEKLSTALKENLKRRRGLAKSRVPSEQPKPEVKLA